MSSGYPSYLKRAGSSYVHALRTSSPPTEVATFDDALRLYYTTEEVRATNADKLAAMNRPIKIVKARHRGRNAAKATEDEADNLCPEFHVCIGARVMLTT